MDIKILLATGLIGLSTMALANRPLVYISTDIGGSNNWSKEDIAATDQSGNSEEFEQTNNPLAFTYGVGLGAEFDRNNFYWLNTVPFVRMRLGLRYSQRNPRQIRGNYYADGEAIATNYYLTSIKTRRVMLMWEGDFTNFKTIYPFISLGIGEAYNHISSVRMGANNQLPTSTLKSNTSSNLAYQAGLGLNFKISKHISSYIAYNFVSANDIAPDNQLLGTTSRFQNPPEFSMYFNEFLLGIRAYF